MAEINEAYRVLSDTGRRRLYDLQITAAPVTSPGTSPASGRPAPARNTDFTTVLPEVTPARFPWKFMLVLATFGIGIVVVGLIFTRPATPALPDNILHPGECVDISTDLFAAEVLCSGVHDAVVKQLVGFDETCPRDTERYLDRQGRGYACVVRITP